MAFKMSQHCLEPHHHKLMGFLSSIRGYKAFMDWEKGEGDPFPYYVYGAACSEVEIDCLTGAHKVSRRYLSSWQVKTTTSKLCHTINTCN